LHASIRGWIEPNSNGYFIFLTPCSQLTAYRYGTTLKADGTLILPYTIKMEHASREVGLTLMADIMDSSKNHFPVLIYNSTVNFTEPIQGWVDIQL